MSSFREKIALRIADIQIHNKLYEGLIYTYSIQDTNNVLYKNQLKYGYKYDILGNKNKNLPYISINILKNNSISEILEINKLMNNCGWYPVDIIDINDERYHDKKILNTFLINNRIKYIIYRAKFDIEIERKFWPKYLYHVTHLKNLNKIKKYGLIPKSEGKLMGHEDHIYLYDIRNNNFILRNFAEDIENYFTTDSKYKNIPEEYKKKYVILKINMGLLKNYTRLFYDPDLNDAYFTLDNINPSFVELKEIIDLNK